MDYVFKQLIESTIRIPKIIPHHLALGDFQGQASISLGEDQEVNSLLTDSLPGRPSQIIQVDTIEHFCETERIPRIDILKIDVEGFEVNVLKGAGSFLETNVALVYAEFGYIPSDKCKTYFPDLNDFLLPKGFRLCGLYENFRWGGNKRFLGFGNALYLNTALVK